MAAGSGSGPQATEHGIGQGYPYLVARLRALRLLRCTEMLKPWQLIDMPTHWNVTVTRCHVRECMPRLASGLDEANTILDRLYEDLSPLEAFIR